MPDVWGDSWGDSWNSYWATATAAAVQADEALGGGVRFPQGPKVKPATEIRRDIEQAIRWAERELAGENEPEKDEQQVRDVAVAFDRASQAAQALAEARNADAERLDLRRELVTVQKALSARKQALDEQRFDDEMAEILLAHHAQRLKLAQMVLATVQEVFNGPS